MAMRGVGGEGAAHSPVGMGQYALIDGPDGLILLFDRQINERRKERNGP